VFGDFLPKKFIVDCFDGVKLGQIYRQQALKAMFHKTVLWEENNKLINDASTTSFSRPYVVKSIQSWTIT